MRAWLLFAAVFVAPAAARAGEPLVLEIAQTVSLAPAGWQFHTGDDLAWARPEFDDHDWETLNLERSWARQGHRGYSGPAWYRLAVRLPEGVPLSDLREGVTIGNIATSYELYAGGRLLGGLGALPPHPRLYYDRHATYAIPAAAVAPDGRLVLAMRVWKSPEFLESYGGPDGGPFLIGPVDDLTRRALVSELPELVLAGIFLVAALYHVFLFRGRTQAVEYLWFSAFALDAALYTLARTQWKYLLTDNFELLKEAEYFLLYVTVPLSLQFFFTTVDHRPRPWVRAYQWSHVVLALAVSLTPGLGFNIRSLHPWEAWSLIGVAVGFTTIAQRVRQGHPEARTLAIGLVAWAGASFFDIAGDVLGLGQTRTFQFGFAMFLFSMAVSLANRFSRVHRELDSLNQDLEQRVAARTRELADANESLSLEKRRAEEALGEAERQRQAAIAAQAEADQANQAKSRFLANMSHELRTPLNGVLGFAQLMERRPGRDAEDRHRLGAIQRSGSHLLGLINDVLSLAKIEAGGIVLAEAPFDPARMLQSIEEMLRERAESRGLRLTLEVSGLLPRAVRGDEGKLRQVLINLLGNAVKFTQEGEVTLRARWGDGRGHFEVEDTGPGIAPEEMSRLFEPFVQTETGQRSREGTGLGLALSRQIARRMGGDITARSEVGRGTCFCAEVALPATEEAVETAAAAARRVLGLAEGQGRPRILIADDVADNRDLLRGLLESAGFEVRGASTGEEALQAWREWHPRFIWMDKRMPVLDGLEATRRIRADEQTQGLARVPILALSASALEHERADVLAAGCDDFVSKPFREDVIFARMADHLGLRYLYAEDAPALTTLPTLPPTSPERLRQVPAALRAELQRALSGGDLGRAAEVVHEMGATDRPLADALQALLGSYALDELESLLAAAAELGVAPAAPS
jgi:signal transduction histidine kinase/DNA-binding NarL/FixJ family response regulator